MMQTHKMNEPTRCISTSPALTKCNPIGEGRNMAESHATGAPRASQEPFEIPSAAGRHPSFKHGLTELPEYRAWQTMRLRCSNPANQAYPDYGGRGITVCDRWKEDFLAFLEDMGRKPSPKHELDRENNNGNYEPGNCRWVVRKVNDRNRRSNRHLTFCGQTKVVAEWCEELNLPRDTVHKRLKAGWTVEEALTIPVQSKRPNGVRIAERAAHIPVRPRIAPDRQQRVAELFKAGRTYDQIVAETGVSYNTVGRIIKRLGVKR